MDRPRRWLVPLLLLALLTGRASAQLWPEHADVPQRQFGAVGEVSASEPVFDRQMPPQAGPTAFQEIAPLELRDESLAGYAFANDEVPAFDEVPNFEPHDDCVACRPGHANDVWGWKLLPQAILYRAYLAGVKESRFGSAWVHTRDQGWLWDIALGGRVGILRYGNLGETNPEGYQLDIEGAGLPRLDLEEEHDLVSADFRFGIPFTYRQGPWQAKLAYYHLSSHLGDEYMIKNPSYVRYNYSRDVAVLGLGYFVTDELRLYGEAGWAFACDVGEPWEFQFGFDYAPAYATGLRGAPFVAANGHLREEVEFGGNLVFQAGWAWRGGGPGRLFRLGFEYFNGKSRQFEFFDQFEEQLGLGLWYDY